MNIKVEKGFTLIELVVVVAVIGIISSVAIPSYLDYIVRTNRVDATDMLTQVNYELERYNTRKRTYTTDLAKLGFTEATGGVFLSKKGLYSITVAACGTTAQLKIGKCAKITAKPVSGKGQDGDGDLTLDTRGKKEGKWEAK